MISGNAAIKVSITIYANTNGKTAIEILSIPKLVIRAATKRFAPTGGVKNPTSQAITIIIPKAIGCTPRFWTSGSNNGVRSII